MAHSGDSRPREATTPGDCFLAGYVAARYEGGSARECLAYGVACGAESTQRLGAGPHRDLGRPMQPADGEREACGVDPTRSQTWHAYALALLAFNLEVARTREVVRELDFLVPEAAPLLAVDPLRVLAAGHLEAVGRARELHALVGDRGDVLHRHPAAADQVAGSLRELLGRGHPLGGWLAGALLWHFAAMWLLADGRAWAWWLLAVGGGLDAGGGVDRSVDALLELLTSRGYLAERSLATVTYLSLRMGRPLFLEGEAGVGKTEIAKVLVRFDNVA